MNDHAAASEPGEIALAREAPFDLAGTLVRPPALEVEHNGVTTSLEPRVMKVLVALRRGEGEPVSRDALIGLCWGGRVVTESALNRCVAQLRKALAANERIRLETIPTVGYRLQRAPAPFPNESAAAPLDPPPPVRPLVARKTKALLAGLSAATIAVLAAAWLFVSSRPVVWSAISYHPLTSTPEQEGFPALSPNGEQMVYSLRPDAYSARTLYLRNVDQGTPVRITFDTEDNYGAAWSSAGDRIAFVRSYDEAPCALIVVPVPLGPERVVTRCQTALQTKPSWLDARTLAFADQPKTSAISLIRAVDVETGLSRDLTSPPASTLGDTEPQSSPDGHYIVFRRTLTIGADDLYMLDISSGKERPLTHDGWKAAGYVWSADSRYVFFSSNRGGDLSLWSVDRRIDGPPRPVSLGLGTVSFSRMSSDRKNRLVVELTRGHINLARVTSSGEIQPVTAGAGSDFDPAVAADGTITYISNRNGAYEIWITGPDRQSVRLTSILASYVTRPTWSPDDQTIAFVAVKGRNAELYTIARDGSQLRQITSDGVHKKDPAYDASGKHLFYTEHREGKWRLMRIALFSSPVQPQAVSGGEGWGTLHAGPNGMLFGQRNGDNTIRALDPSKSAAAIIQEDGLRLADVDVWTVGAQGIYVRRGRQVHQPSSIWLYPWHQPGRKLADTSLASGSIGLEPNGDPIFSQALDFQVDLGLMELAR